MGAFLLLMTKPTTPAQETVEEKPQEHYIYIPIIIRKSMMSEPLVKQIVDLKDEHTLMLEALKLVLKYFNTEPTADEYIEMIQSVTVAKVAAEMGNERRAAGNIDLPDKRGIKVNG